MQNAKRCHVLAVPYPGRGHVNPMMNLCKLLAAKRPDSILITFVVTEEWLSFIASDIKPDNIQFTTIPNILPSELVRGADFPGFYNTVMTKMGGPFENLIDRLELPVNTIVADTELPWAIRIGNKRKIPVAVLCTFPARVFSIFLRFARITDPNMLLHFLDCESEFKEPMEGICSMHVAELRKVFHPDEAQVMQLTLKAISLVPEAQYVLFNSVSELEPEIFETLKQQLHLPMYPIGPAIPYIGISSPSTQSYFEWLDSQQDESVLYLSMGSFLSTSRTQMEEIAAGLHGSGVPYFWAARGEVSWLKDACGDKGLIVPWCEQLKVLCHCSIGGFWTHCGWNSTLEAVFTGVPMLTFPFFYDQITNGEQIVDKWQIGWKVKHGESVVSREEITRIVRQFMDINNSERNEIRRRAKELQEICRQAIIGGGSSDTNLEAFIKDILKGCYFY